MASAPARGQARSIDIAASSLTVHASLDTTEGAYYTLSVAVPAGIETIRQAWLELRADVDVSEIEGFRDPAPVFQVFMLKSELSGEPTEESFEVTRVPMSRPVALGTRRLIRIDVADFVRKIVANPSANHGLVLGSVTGDRRASFEVDGNGFGAGVAARLTIME